MPTTTSPHYRKKFDAAGVHPDDFRRLEDLGQVPVHRPRRICATTIPSACSPCRASKIARIHASSGTTGKPTVVGYTKGDIDIWADARGALDPRLGRHGPA